MQRVNIPAGRIGWHQWRRVAALAATYSPGFPLHITTRQDIEFHNIMEQDICAVQQGLAEASLTTFGAGGDSVRNITVCPACDFCSKGRDLMPLTQLVGQHLHQHPAIFNLPRKFKLSFSGCERACARAWLGDLGFVARPGGTFMVIGAGSLGARPALGIELYDELPGSDVLPVCAAAVEFFEEHRDRQNRHRARFRHVRENLGDDAFRAELDARLARVKARQSWPEVSQPASRDDVVLLHRLQPPNGNISPSSALELADAAQPKGAVLRINLDHGLELYGRETFELPESLEAFAGKPVIVACPGSVTCSKGLVDCWAAAANIRDAIGGLSGPDMRICISGCPNNCAHSAVADIGLIGILKKENGDSVQYYRLLRGGGNGRTPRLAEPWCIARAIDIAEIIKRELRKLKPPVAQMVPFAGNAASDEGAKITTATVAKILYNCLETADRRS